MELSKAIGLIQPGVMFSSGPSSWADLGCGDGLFTSALARLLPEDSIIYAVDTNQKALNRIHINEQVKLFKIKADFTKDPMPFTQLDGLLMANSLHFVADKISFLQKAQQWLRKEGCMLLVEYDMDTANPWVPYPVSFTSLMQLFQELGYTTIQHLGELPSRYNRANIYAARVVER